MTPQRGEIWYYEAKDGIGSQQIGIRPCVIVSNDIGNFHGEIVEIVPLTSEKRSKLPTHIDIVSTPRRSIAFCEQITTVSKQRLLNHIGYISPKEMNWIDQGLRISLGLTQ